MKFLPLLALLLLSANESGCTPEPITSSGIPQAQASVVTGPSGMTVEQENVKRRIEEDNKPGTSKFLYVLSPYSGEVVIQSTVKGKVSSGGKRLEPSTYSSHDIGPSMPKPNSYYNTQEVMQPDGTYGSSGDYLYWWDVTGVYHQHYLTGGQIVHVASQPMSFGRVTMEVESSVRSK